MPQVRRALDTLCSAKPPTRSPPPRARERLRRGSSNVADAVAQCARSGSRRPSFDLGEAPRRRPRARAVPGDAQEDCARARARDDARRGGGGGRGRLAAGFEGACPLTRRNSTRAGSSWRTCGRTRRPNEYADFLEATTAIMTVEGQDATSSTTSEIIKNHFRRRKKIGAKSRSSNLVICSREVKKEEGPSAAAKATKRDGAQSVTCSRCRRPLRRRRQDRSSTPPRTAQWARSRAPPARRRPRARPRTAAARRAR